jgi:hypothetical protein
MSVFVKVLDAIVWTFEKIIMPLTRLTFYLLVIALFMALIANLAGILGAIIFFIAFYYYVSGILFVEPIRSFNPPIPNISNIQKIVPTVP